MTRRKVMREWKEHKNMKFPEYNLSSTVGEIKKGWIENIKKELPILIVAVGLKRAYCLERSWILDGIYKLLQRKRCSNLVKKEVRGELLELLKDLTERYRKAIKRDEARIGKTLKERMCE